MNSQMNRRRFIQASGFLAASAVLASAQSERAPIRKAINLGMVAAPSTATVEERFQAIKEAGFEGVEVNRPDAIPLKELMGASAATGLPVAGIICSTHWDKPLTHNDAAVREQGKRGIKLALSDAAELGCNRLLLVPGVVNRETFYADAYQRSRDAIAEMLPFAEQAKCKIAVENVWNEFLLSPLEAARFLDELNSPWVGWHFDVGNVVRSGWPEQWIRILGRRILNIHIKEYSRKKRDQEGMPKGFNVELGEGDVDWPAVAKALAEVEFEGWGILEVPGGDAARLKFLAERSSSLL
jgi:L-ribulose-5-phosphate 3-epimerase